MRFKALAGGRTKGCVEDRRSEPLGGRASHFLGPDMLRDMSGSRTCGPGQAREAEKGTQVDGPLEWVHLLQSK